MIDGVFKEAVRRTANDLVRQESDVQMIVGNYMDHVADIMRENMEFSESLLVLSADDDVEEILDSSKSAEELALDVDEDVNKQEAEPIDALAVAGAAMDLPPDFNAEAAQGTTPRAEDQEPVLGPVSE